MRLSLYCSSFYREINLLSLVLGLASRYASFFFGVYSWLVKVLGQFSIIYFRGLGLRIGVRVWVRVRVGVRVWVRVRVRVSVVLWSGVSLGLGSELGLGL